MGVEMASTPAGQKGAAVAALSSASTAPRAAVELTGTPSQGLAGATIAFFVGFAAVALFGPTAKELKDVMSLTPSKCRAPRLSTICNLHLTAHAATGGALGRAN